jgi:hypothetical protein
MAETTEAAGLPTSGAGNAVRTFNVRYGDADDGAHAWSDRRASDYFPVGAVLKWRDNGGL